MRKNKVKKRIIKVMSVALAIVMMLTSGAFALSTVSGFSGTTYTHSDLKSNCLVVQGVDVSAYQNTIDWQKMKSSGVDFAIIRCGGRFSASGELYPDSHFQEYMDGAKAAGLMVGVYFYSQSCGEMESRSEVRYADELIREAGYTPDDLDLPLYMDYEFYTSGNPRLYSGRFSKSSMTKFATAWCEMAKELGYTPGIYANYNFSTKTIDGASLTQKYSYWAAQYNKNNDFPFDYPMWQYSSGGKVLGSGSNSTDVNFLYLDLNPVNTVGQPAGTVSLRNGLADNNHLKMIEIQSLDPETGIPLYDTETFVPITEKVPCNPANYSLTNAYVSVSAGSYTYDGINAFKPYVSVSCAGRTLIEGIDYKLKYVGNSQAGTAYALVIGMGEFTDYKLAPFTIKPSSSIGGITIDPIESKDYTGKELKPSKLTIKDAQGRLLRENKDYTYTVSNNINPGIANVTVSFMGNYKGSKSATFEIEKAVQKITLSNEKATVDTTEGAFNIGAVLKYEGEIQYKSSNPEVASIDETGLVTPLKKGETTITVSAPKTSQYDAAVYSFKLTVTSPKLPQTVTTAYTKYKREVGGKSFNVKAETDGDGIITYESSNPEIATIDETGKVTVVGNEVGTVELRVMASETEDYSQGLKIVYLTVSGTPKNEAEKAEENAKLDAKNERIIAGVEATKVISLKATQPASGKVRLDWKKSGSGYAVDTYQIWKSTKKSSGYKKIFTSSDAKKKYYINTKDVKKNTTYWYKVRGIRKVTMSDGTVITAYTPFTKVSIKTK